ncbi:MAG: LptF/LptG family permease [Candidatus Cloacimonetes bacterium]|nr:LptF/LptG family permease [Candidatus Cloacimonadota bacterium]
MKILERYILRENFKPFITSLLVVTLLMIFDRLLDLLKVIIEKHLIFVTVAEIFGLSLPFMLALTIPMAVLLATIMSFGRLSTDNELIAFKSCGINIFTLMRPTIIAAILLSVFMLYFNDRILPESNHILKNKMIQVNYRRPVTAIKPGVFNQMKNYTIYARERIGEELHGLIIYNREAADFPTTISAARGTIQLADGGNSMTATLYDGEMHERDNKDKKVYSIRSFDKLTLNMPDLGYQMKEMDSDYRGDREMSVEAMEAVIAEQMAKMTRVEAEIDSLLPEINKLQAIEIKSDEDARKLKQSQNSARIKNEKIDNYLKKIRIYEVEIHKKYAMAFACLIFVLIGAPVGMMTKSNGVGMAFTVSSIVFMIYYGALTGGEELADKGLVSPWLSMWIANIILGIIGVYLIITSMREMRVYDLNRAWKRLLRKMKKRKKLRRKTGNEDADTG